jgi:integrase
MNGLAAARQAAQAARDLIAKGIDPIDARKRPEAPSSFAEHSRAVIKALSPGWRNPKTAANWEYSLLTHAALIGRIPVNEVGTEDVLRVLRPLWLTKAASAVQLRERIERVLDYARVSGHIIGPWENPARWRGHLALILPKRPKLQRGRMRAISYRKAPAVMARLRQLRGWGPRALEFTVLTAAREGMVIAAEWSEIQGDVWVVPAERMKGAEEFRVPLSAAALAVLERVPGRGARAGYIFKGSRSRRGGHISGATMDRVCGESLQIDASPHGFRSTFRDWAGDCTDHPREVAEMCLAHVVGNETERAYRRGDALAKRRLLLEDWAAYLAGGD